MRNIVRVFYKPIGGEKIVTKQGAFQPYG